MVAIVLRKALEHCLDVVARARAFRAQRTRAEDAHARSMEKSVKQLFTGKRRIDQLNILRGRNQGLTFRPGVVFFDSVWFTTIWGTADIEIGNTRSFGGPRQELQHDAAGAPAVRGTARSRAQFLGDRKPHPGRDLLRANKIFLRYIFQRAAIERD